MNDAIKFTKKKIVGKNLSSQLGRSQTFSSRDNPTTTSNSGRRLLVLGPSKRNSRKKRSNLLAPVNTTSLKKENKGQDSSIEIVPSGGGGWADKDKTKPSAQVIEKVRNDHEDSTKPAWSSGSNVDESPGKSSTKSVGPYRAPRRWGDEVVEDKPYADQDFPDLGVEAPVAKSDGAKKHDESFKPQTEQKYRPPSSMKNLDDDRMRPTSSRRDDYYRHDSRFDYDAHARKPRRGYDSYNKYDRYDSEKSRFDRRGRDFYDNMRGPRDRFDSFGERNRRMDRGNYRGRFAYGEPGRAMERPSYGYNHDRGDNPRKVSSGSNAGFSPTKTKSAANDANTLPEKSEGKETSPAKETPVEEAVPMTQDEILRQEALRRLQKEKEIREQEEREDRERQQRLIDEAREKRRREEEAAMRREKALRAEQERELAKQREIMEAERRRHEEEKEALKRELARLSKVNAIPIRETAQNAAITKDEKQPRDKQVRGKNAESMAWRKAAKDPEATRAPSREGGFLFDPKEDKFYFEERKDPAHKRAQREKKKTSGKRELGRSQQQKHGKKSGEKKSIGGRVVFTKSSAKKSPTKSVSILKPDKLGPSVAFVQSPTPAKTTNIWSVGGLSHQKLGKKEGNNRTSPGKKPSKSRVDSPPQPQLQKSTSNKWVPPSKKAGKGNSSSQGNEQSSKWINPAKSQSKKTQKISASSSEEATKSKESIDQQNAPLLNSVESKGWNNLGKGGDDVPFVNYKDLEQHLGPYNTSFGWNTWSGGLGSLPVQVVNDSSIPSMDAFKAPTPNPTTNQIWGGQSVFLTKGPWTAPPVSGESEPSSKYDLGNHRAESQENALADEIGQSSTPRNSHVPTDKSNPRSENANDSSEGRNANRRSTSHQGDKSGAKQGHDEKTGSRATKSFSRNKNNSHSTGNTRTPGKKTSNGRGSGGKAKPNGRQNRQRKGYRGAKRGKSNTFRATSGKSSKGSSDK